MSHTLRPVVLVLALALFSFAEAHAGIELNPFILDAVKELTSERAKVVESGGKPGKYGVGTDGSAGLKTIKFRNGDFDLAAMAKVDTVCSTATDAGLLKGMHKSPLKGLLTPAQWELLTWGTADGQGPYGRINSNGPGLARWARKFDIGRSFYDSEQARPGDLVKIFWNEKKDGRRLGHSVVFLGFKTDPAGKPILVRGKKVLRFWSSNQPGGMGESQAPLADIAFAVYTRLDKLENLPRALERFAKEKESWVAANQGKSPGQRDLGVDDYRDEYLYSLKGGQETNDFAEVRRRLEGPEEPAGHVVTDLPAE